MQDRSSAGLYQHLQVPPTIEHEKILDESWPREHPVPYMKAVIEVLYQMKENIDNPMLEKIVLLKTWMKKHPAPSWAVVTEALYQMEEHDVLKRVKMFISGMLGWRDVATL